LVIIATFWLAGCITRSARYHNELPGYQFYANAPWKSLIPLESSIADVRRVLGSPTTAKDIANYSAPYPGDDKAEQPVWTYDLNENWQILVYFVKTGYFERRKFPKRLYKRLYSIDYVPKGNIRFDKSRLPASFQKKHTIAADAAWDEYSDGSGLVYQVYTTKTPYGGKYPGDLNRIKYGPSDDQVQSHSMK